MKNINSTKIMDKIEERKQDIKKYGVKKIGLFGSFVKGKQHRKSDVDIIVTFENIDFDTYIGLKLMLEKMFGRNVDLVIEKDLRPELKNIKKGIRYVKL